MLSIKTLDDIIWRRLDIFIFNFELCFTVVIFELKHVLVWRDF